MANVIAIGLLVDREGDTHRAWLHCHHIWDEACIRQQFRDAWPEWRVEAVWYQPWRGEIA